MIPKHARILLAVPLLALAAFAGGCPKDEEPAPEPVPPSYPPADVVSLITHKGGTGGGPNMGNFTLVLFDDDDPADGRARLAQTEVLLWHGGGTLVRKTTDANGQADFPGITPGAVSFTALKAGFVNQTVVDLNAATAALGMKRRRIEVSGTVTRAQAGSRVEIELQTKEWNGFDGKAVEKYGYVTSSAAMAVGTGWAYALRLRGGVTEYMIVREMDPATGKILHRDVRQIVQTASPPWADKPATDFPFTGATSTGLHEVSWTVGGVNTGTDHIKAWYEENLIRYSSYSSVDNGNGTFTVKLQMPPTKPNAKIVFDTLTSPAADASPAESYEQTYSSGGADNTPGAPVAFTQQFNTVHGEFSHPVGNSNVFLLETRYNERNHLSFGVKQWPGVDYSIRLPTGVSATCRVLELQGTGSGVLGTIVSHLEETVTAGASIWTHDFDLQGRSAVAIDATAVVPAGLELTNALSALTGPYPNGRFLTFPFMTAGTAAGGQISYPIRYGPLASFTFLLLAFAEETATGAMSMYLHGSLTDPLATLGAAPSLPLADVARVHGPADGATVVRAGLTFAWTGDPDVATEGYTFIDLKDSDGEKVWSVGVRGSTQQFRLEELPSDLRATYDLAATAAYTFQVSAILRTGLAFDAFTFDSIPQKIEDMAVMTGFLRSTSGARVTFTLQ